MRKIDSSTRLAALHGSTSRQATRKRRLSASDRTGACLWHVAVEGSYPGGYWLCAVRSSEAELQKAVYGEGLELGRATVARTIFERLVKEGRVERPC